MCARRASPQGRSRPTGSDVVTSARNRPCSLMDTCSKTPKKAPFCLILPRAQEAFQNSEHAPHPVSPQAYPVRSTRFWRFPGLMAQRVPRAPDPFGRCSLPIRPRRIREKWKTPSFQRASCVVSRSQHQDIGCLELRELRRPAARLLARRVRAILRPARWRSKNIELGCAARIATSLNLNSSLNRISLPLRIDSLF
jgi:hypothetical protein